jgi:hypothetical protein
MYDEKAVASKHYQSVHKINMEELMPQMLLETTESS